VTVAVTVTVAMTVIVMARVAVRVPMVGVGRSSAGGTIGIGADRDIGAVIVACVGIGTGHRTRQAHRRHGTQPARLRGMDIDTASVDEALATTRSVRRRLDLTRPVDDSIIVDCIDIAEQAPTGGNRSARRWLVVRDPAVKVALAELYRDVAGKWMIETRDRLAGSGHPDEAMMTSAAYLAEHLAEVPAIVIPAIVGIHDGSGRPGLFDSVLQSAWSFCVALRARGLGTAWTTAVLSDRERLGELLAMPDDVTPVAMLPVAWTIGTDFRRVARTPAREIMYVDRWGRTTDRSAGGTTGAPATGQTAGAPAGGTMGAPATTGQQTGTHSSGPLRLADGPGVVVERDIGAHPRVVWKLVSDIAMPVAFSDELVAVRWDDDEDDTTARMGRRFVGSNHHRRRGDWEVPCWVDVYEPKRAFGWCTSDPDNSGARWRFELEPRDGGTRLRFRMALGPGPSGLTEVVASMPDDEARLVARRLDEHEQNMRRVLDGVAALATG
jgi:nitroreductase